MAFPRAGSSSLRAIQNLRRRGSLLAGDSYVRHSSHLASSYYTSPEGERTNESTSSTPLHLNAQDRTTLERMLRVDHSGEIAANTIYVAQSRVFHLLGDTSSGRMFEEMLETEKKHLAVTERLLSQHRVRPSALNPVWSVAGSFLGAVTALLGREGAMAATEAVETVIGEHYDDQLTSLEAIAQRSDVEQTDDEKSLQLLTEVIREFRDDELEHLDTAVEHDAQQAPAHALLSAVIGFGCKGAIQIAKRI